MKVLCIARDGRELVQSLVTRPVLLVGRSPTCDIVLRASGVKPVHFLIEWLGTGSFTKTEGSWTVTDISEAPETIETEKSDIGYGQGVVIAGTDASVGDFKFYFKEDPLTNVDISGGALSESFAVSKNRSDEKKTSGLVPHVLEVVSVRTDSDSVYEVHHLKPPKGAKVNRPIYNLPQLMVQWDQKSAEAPIRLLYGNLPGARIYRRGLLVDIGKNSEKIAGLRTGDIVKINWQLEDHYFRLVPHIKVPPVRISLLSDPFYRYLLICLLLIVFLWFFAGHEQFKAVTEVQPPPRIAKVEIKEVVPTPPEPPKPPAPVKVEEPPIELPPPKAKPLPVVKKLPEKKVEPPKDLPEKKAAPEPPKQSSSGGGAKKLHRYLKET